MGFQIGFNRFRKVAAGALASAEPAPTHEIRLSGFDGRTRLTTSLGEIPAQLIRKNDELRARDGSYRKVLAVEALRLDADYLHYHPEAAPLRISAGAFGGSRPWQDIYLAPDQVIGGGLSEGESFICRARDLEEHPMVLRERAKEAVYYLFRLDAPAAILCEKVWVRVE